MIMEKFVLRFESGMQFEGTLGVDKENGGVLVVSAGPFGIMRVNGNNAFELASRVKQLLNERMKAPLPSPGTGIDRINVPDLFDAWKLRTYKKNCYGRDDMLAFGITVMHAAERTAERAVAPAEVPRDKE